jgi:hypothetical protein
MRTRYFTPEEANRLISQVRTPMIQIRSALRELRELAEILDPDDETVILSDELRERGLERAQALQLQIQALVEEVGRLGAEVKDLDGGLIDFPALKEGQEVCLCWRLGEDQITHWHGVREGYHGRKSLSGVHPAEWVWFS